MNKPAETTEMIERVVKALKNSCESELIPEAYERMARAAMEAMLDPTDTMLIYGCQKANLSPAWEIAKIWRGMIHAALGKFYKSPE